MTTIAELLVEKGLPIRMQVLTRTGRPIYVITDVMSVRENAVSKRTVTVPSGFEQIRPEDLARGRPAQLPSRPN